MSMQCFIHVKVDFEKKNMVLPIEKFPFPVLPRLEIRWLCSTLLFIILSIIYQVVAYDKLLALKARWSRSLARGGRFQEVPN